MAVALHFAVATAILLSPQLQPPSHEAEHVIELVLAPDTAPAPEPEQPPQPQAQPVAKPAPQPAPVIPTKVAKASPPKPQAVSEAAPSEPAANPAATASDTEAAAPAPAPAPAAPSSSQPTHPGTAPLVDGPPSALQMPRPSYPRLARQRGWEGVVLLSVEVNELGCPNSVTVRRSSGHAALDEAAVEAARRWHFRPAIKDGRIMTATVEVPIRFSLSDA
jgi:protein TonB